MLSIILSVNSFISSVVEMSWQGWWDRVQTVLQLPQSSTMWWWRDNPYRERLLELWDQWTQHPHHRYHMEALSMLGLALLFVYSGELYRGLQWILARTVCRKQPSTTGSAALQKRRGCDPAPPLDITEGSLEEDVVFGSIVETISSSPKLHNNKQQHPERRRSRRSYSSIERIPEDAVLRTSDEEEDELDWLSADHDDDQDAATARRSNASPASPASNQAEDGPNAAAEASSSRLRRTAGPVSVDALRAQLQQKTPLSSQAQRLGAVSTSTLLKTYSKRSAHRRSHSFRSSLPKEEDPSSPPVAQLRSSHHRRGSWNRRSHSVRSLRDCYKSNEMDREDSPPYRRASSLSQLTLSSEPKQSSPQSLGNDSTEGYEVRIDSKASRKHPHYAHQGQHRRCHSSSLTSSTTATSASSSKHHRRLASETATAATTTHRHLVDDVRLLERMARSQQSHNSNNSHYKSNSSSLGPHTHKTIHVVGTPPASMDSALSSL